MTPLILFDDGLGHLGFLRDLRASFELRTGALTTAERLIRQCEEDEASAWFVPKALEGISRDKHPCINTIPNGPEVFVVANGRLTHLHTPIPSALNHAVIDGHGHVLCARLDRQHARQFLLGDCQSTQGLTTEIQKASMLQYPWDVIKQFPDNLEHDLAEMKSLKPMSPSRDRFISIEGKAPVRVGHHVTMGANVVFDTTQGPVAIDDHATIRPMVVINGPAYVGPHTLIKSMSNVRARSSIGPHCKIGGEVSHSIFQAHANKAHEGFIGNSFIGEWTNLGAGTTTSNLKNTYGPVRMQWSTDVETQDTDMRFLGSIIGDHVKTAVRTQFQTGTCVQTGSMIAVSGPPPKCVQPFSFLTEKGRQIYNMDKFIEVVNTVMGRREAAVTEAILSRLRTLHQAVH